MKYKGKKLDIYKAMYHKKCQQQKDVQDNPSEGELRCLTLRLSICATINSLLDDEKEVITKPIELPVPPRKNLMQHGVICNRMMLQDINMLVEAVPFSSIGRIQPFLINITTSATLLIDFHCHLTTSEVSGYLGGTWDFNTHNLNITHTFPLLNSRFDREKSSECEYEIQKTMLEKNIQLVGWYHSHPRFSPQPTLRDCDKQMDYQIKLRGSSDSTYTPCVGLIFSSYDDNDDIESEGQMLPFWVLPPPENRPHELGRPMMMSYSIHQEENLSEGIKDQMIGCVNYYKQFQYELLDFADMKLNDKAMVLEKLKNSMFQRFPSEDQTSGELWNWILELLGLNREDPVIIPRRIIEHRKRMADEARQKEEAAKAKLIKDQEERKLKEEREQEATKQALNAISCLQQQLSQPSGLNMTPSPISSAILSMPSSGNHKQSSSSNATNTSSSPRDSPATIPSTATSPAKFEVPVRASPSPAKSDTSSIRARNSPAPSPAKLPDRPPRNSSSVSSSSSKYDLGYNSSNLSDLYAATLASFAKNLPPGLLPTDYASLLQGSKMSDFGMSALGSLQASAAALSAGNSYSQQGSGSGSGSGSSGGKKNQSSYSNSKQSNASTSAAAAAAASSNSWLSQIPNMKEFMNQLEKGDLSVLMQSPYNIPTCKPSNKSSASGSSSARTDYHHDNVREPSGAGKRKGRPPNPASSFDYDGYKSEMGKISDLMKSPEYTQMLMNQANAFRGLGSEITVTRKPSNAPSAPSSSSSSSNNKKASSTATSNQNYSQASASSSNAGKSSLLNHLPVMDLNYLAEISKQIPELNALLNSNKPEDINALLQMQMMSKNMDYATALFGGAGGSGSSGGSSGGGGSNNKSSNSASAATAKAMQDYAAASSSMLSQYMSNTPNLSSIFGPMYGMSGGSLTSMEKASPREANTSNSRKRDNSNRNSGGSSASAQSNRDRHSNVNVAPNAADMLNSLFASATKGSQLSNTAANLMHSDLSSYFSSAATNTSSSLSSTSAKVNNSTSGGGITSAMDYSSLFSHMTPSKLQEMTSLFSQSKYPGIPDPLAKSTLAANNAYLSPSLMKLQQEALNTRLMKPPKSSSSSSSSKIETPPPTMGRSSPHSDKRSTPTKSLRDNSPASLPKYNFSAADLAISSHIPPSASSTPTDFSRKSTPTPPVDLAMKERSVPPKKRMEFSSIAELVAPSPSKRQKYADDDNEDEPAVLNLSNN